MLAAKLRSVANLPSQIRLGLNSTSSEQWGLSDLVWLHFNNLLPPCPASLNQFAVCLWCMLVLWFCFEGVCSRTPAETTTYCSYCTSYWTCTEIVQTDQLHGCKWNKHKQNTRTVKSNHKNNNKKSHTSTPCCIITPLTLLRWRADVDHWRKTHIKCTTLQQKQHKHI